ncbi:glycosyltransferase family 2 protein [Zhihengliuella flava]|uniref:Glycosyltransferase n=1 Tax=Zhihengliuella flava TaxID=1285193 RepID=A0A931D9S8_9MICC|nr:galactosyltransferase-related protein [Zhihengliuella flava]MBG6083536.1 hypothetical protein [Zhihengliuella flava]
MTIELDHEATEGIELSVVYGFRNWDTQRLELSIRSVQASFGERQGEVIVVDYGSDDPDPAARVCSSTGARLVRIEDAPRWSRSRALNAGFAAARGRLLISTDADIIFSPHAMEGIHSWWLASPQSALFLQCRDLPSAATPADWESIDWGLIRRSARLRPRWGMGGMMAISREGLGRIRGFDERLHTYGREDMDLGWRAARAGYRTVWVEDERVAMYHLWHQPALQNPEISDAVKQAVRENRAIVDHERTWARNTDAWRYRLTDAPELLIETVPSASLVDLAEWLEEGPSFLWIGNAAAPVGALAAMEVAVAGAQFRDGVLLRADLCRRVVDRWSHRAGSGAFPYGKGRTAADLADEVRRAAGEAGLRWISGDAEKSTAAPPAETTRPAPAARRPRKALGHRRLQRIMRRALRRGLRRGKR